MRNLNGIVNPKQRKETVVGRSAWYPYYPGFSSIFVESVLASHEPSALPGGVFDPWNGAGTTTSVASLAGFDSRGLDLNPVMLVAAKAKLIGSSSWRSLEPLAGELIQRSNKCVLPADISSDPLSTWLKPKAVFCIRSIEQSIQRALIRSDFQGPQVTFERLQALSSLAAFYYLALFRTTRSLLDGFIGSNKTWVKAPKDHRSRLSPSKTTIVKLFQSNVQSMAISLSEAANHADDSTPGETNLLLGSSADIPLEDESISLVLTSPPYCTRIDYIVATSIELAVLGLSRNESRYRQLREDALGTTAIAPGSLVSLDEWGATCSAFLASLKRHESKASSTYYLRNHLQYFSSLWSSLLEIGRIVRGGGRAVVVVQDSYYKNIHNDLPVVVREMFENIGFRLLDERRFPVSSNMSSMNSRAKKYRTKSLDKNYESVLLLEQSHER